MFNSRSKNKKVSMEKVSIQGKYKVSILELRKLFKKMINSR